VRFFTDGTGPSGALVVRAVIAQPFPPRSAIVSMDLAQRVISASEALFDEETPWNPPSDAGAANALVRRPRSDPEPPPSRLA
jgi:hypothetical protein